MVVVKVIAPTSADCSSSLRLAALDRAVGRVLDVLAPRFEGLLGQAHDADHLVALRANTSAMPAPMVPRPITPMVEKSRPVLVMGRILGTGAAVRAVTKFTHR